MKNLFFFLILLMAILINRNAEAQININPQDTVKAALSRAMNLTKQGNIEEASRIYTEIMESHPDNRDAVQGWLMANMKRTRTGEEEAIKQLEELGRLYPKNTGIIFFKAFIEAEYGHYEEALKDIEKLIKIQPDTALNYILKGQVLSSIKKYQESFEAFDKATSLDPKRFDVWGMKAGAQAKIGKFDDAIASINKGLELNHYQTVSIYNRACIYSLKGDKANALADLKKAITMNPSFKKSALKDEDFKSLYNDEDFKKLTMAASEVQVSYSIQFNGKLKPDSVYLFIYPTTKTVDGQIFPEPVKAIATSKLSSSFMIEPGSYTLGVTAWGYKSLKVVINFPPDEKDLSIQVILNPVFIGYGKIKDLNEIKSVSIRGDFNKFREENEIPMKKVGTVWKPEGDSNNLREGRYMFTVNGEHTIDLMNKNVSPLRRWNSVFNLYNNNELVFDPSLYNLGYKASEIETSWKLGLNLSNPDWITYTGKDGSFKVKFPNQPKVEQMPPQYGTLLYGNMEITTISLDPEKNTDDNEQYILNVTDVSPDKISSEVESIKHRGSSLTLMMEKVLSEESISFNNYPGYYAAGEISPGSAQMHRLFYFKMYLVKSRFYDLIVICTPEKKDNPSIKAFFDSFELIEK